MVKGVSTIECDGEFEPLFENKIQEEHEDEVANESEKRKQHVWHFVGFFSEYTAIAVGALSEDLVPIHLFNRHWPQRITVYLI